AHRDVLAGIRLPGQGDLVEVAVGIALVDERAIVIHLGGRIGRIRAVQLGNDQTGLVVVVDGYCDVVDVERGKALDDLVGIAVLGVGGMADDDGLLAFLGFVEHAAHLDRDLPVPGGRADRRRVEGQYVRRGVIAVGSAAVVADGEFGRLAGAPVLLV